MKTEEYNVPIYRYDHDAFQITPEEDFLLSYLRNVKVPKGQKSIQSFYVSNFIYGKAKFFKLMVRWKHALYWDDNSRHYDFVPDVKYKWESLVGEYGNRTYLSVPMKFIRIARENKLTLPYLLLLSDIYSFYIDAKPYYKNHATIAPLIGVHERYVHCVIKELAGMGFISVKRTSRSNVLSLTSKFFDNDTRGTVKATREIETKTPTTGSVTADAKGGGSGIRENERRPRDFTLTPSVQRSERKISSRLQSWPGNFGRDQSHERGYIRALLSFG